MWRIHAKENGLPQNISGRFESFNKFKEYATSLYNHKIKRIELLTSGHDVYCLQVEELNNFVIVLDNNDNHHDGVVVKNCGDVMKLQIKVNEDGKIEDAKFKTYGCGSAIASSSLITEWVRGKSLEEAESIKNTEIVKELALPPVKIHCSHFSRRCYQGCCCGLS